MYFKVREVDYLLDTISHAINAGTSDIAPSTSGATAAAAAQVDPRPTHTHRFRFFSSSSR